jgi:hypothetical protein
MPLDAGNTMPGDAAPEQPEFDLRSRILEVRERSSSVDRMVIAAEVEATLTPDDLSRVVHLTLPLYVKNLITSERSQQAPSTVKGSTSPAGTTKAPKVKQPQPRSWKAEATQEYAARIRAGEVFTGSKWKTLEECDETDLARLAQQREDQARLSAAIAKLGAKVAKNDD